MTRASDCYIGWDDISSFYTILSHLVEIWCVHISVIIPSESIKGDEQQLVPSCCTGSFDWSKESWRNCKQPKTYCQQHGYKTSGTLTVLSSMCFSLTAASLSYTLWYFTSPSTFMIRLLQFILSQLIYQRLIMGQFSLSTFLHVYNSDDVEANVFIQFCTTVIMCIWSRIFEHSYETVYSSTNCIWFEIFHLKI